MRADLFPWQVGTAVMIDIPPHQLYLLALTRSVALQYAWIGERLAGFEEIQRGLSAARTESARGRVWGPALVEAYERAIDWYTLTTGAELLASGDARPARG